MTENLNETTLSLPIVLKYDKSNLPTEEEFFLAVVKHMGRIMVELRESTTHGAWSDSWDVWSGQQYRKVVRRLQPAPFELAAGKPGAVVTEFHARSGSVVEVLSYEPHDAAAPPALIRRGQVQGLSLRKNGDSDENSSDFVAPLVGPYLMLRPNINIEATTGKMAAQFGHATQMAIQDAEPELLRRWVECGYQTCIIRDGYSEFLPYAVVDAGFTEIPSGTETVRSGWVDFSE